MQTIIADAIYTCHNCQTREIEDGRKASSNVCALCSALLLAGVAFGTKPMNRPVLAVKGGCGIGKHARCVVQAVIPMGAEYSHQAKVVLAVPYTNRLRVLWARHASTPDRQEFNLNDGTGTVRFFRQS